MILVMRIGDQTETITGVLSIKPSDASIYRSRRNSIDIVSERGGETQINLCEVMSVELLPEN